MLVEKLFCSFFFNPLISLYIYYDQYEKYGEIVFFLISLGSFPWKWQPYSILGHSRRPTYNFKTAASTAV